jgi:lipid-A-disaccharide synthase
VDFYGFNHQVLGLAAHRKIPAFYYVSPQVWASRPGRAAKIAKLTREIFVIFPFEEALYKKVKGNATFVGHPLLDIMPEPAARDFPPEGGEWKIGILPGSRKAEISRHLPIFLKAFYRIKEQHPKARAYLFAVPEFPDENIVPALESVEKYWSKDVEIVREKDYKVRSQLDFAFTCSGTATLENALLGVPMAVAYKMPKFTYEVAKRVVKTPYVSLVNILLKRPAVKELIQEKATVENLAQEAFALMNDPARMRAARKELTGLRGMLGSHGAAERAAQKILTYLS